MTGATATGYAVPNLNPIENHVNGSLPQAIYQLSKNQSDLNDMFKEVITDFQVRMLDNQVMVIGLVNDVSNSVNDIKKCFSEMNETFKLMTQVIDAMGKKLVAMDDRVAIMQ
jgi:hypothetical protein